MSKAAIAGACSSAQGSSSLRLVPRKIHRAKVGKAGLSPWHRLLTRMHRRGGVHPEPHKQDSASRGIVRLPTPAMLYVPLRQHAGASADPIVKPGEKVLKGQRLAVASGTVSAPVHAPTSGHIVSVGDIPVPHPAGLKAPGVVIESDGQETMIELPNLPDPLSGDPQILAARVAEAGIVGMGGAVYPSAVKLGKSREKVELVLLNGSECEPYLTADDRLMREYASEVIDGARIIAHITGAAAVSIGVEDNKPEAIAALERICRGLDGVRVDVVPARYPMGSAKQLIHAVTGREVPAGGRSSDIGVIMHNVATARAISQALRGGLPLVSRVLTVAGGAVNVSQNVEALVGTPVSEVLDFCGGLRVEPARLLMGGPMMGQILQSREVPVTKGAAGVLALTTDEIASSFASPCIRCGRCVDACPMGLMPVEIAARARSDNFDAALDYGLKDCILCGSCAYVCPSNIPLVHHFQYARGELARRAAEQRQMEYTQRLTKDRTQRLEIEAAAKAAEKAAKTAARKAKAEAAKKARSAKAKAAETPPNHEN